MYIIYIRYLSLYSSTHANHRWVTELVALHREKCDFPLHRAPLARWCLNTVPCDRQHTAQPWLQRGFPGLPDWAGNLAQSGNTDRQTMRGYQRSATSSSSSSSASVIAQAARTALGCVRIRVYSLVCTPIKVA